MVCNYLEICIGALKLIAEQEIKKRMNNDVFCIVGPRSERGVELLISTVKYLIGIIQITRSF